MTILSVCISCVPHPVQSLRFGEEDGHNYEFIAASPRYGVEIQGSLGGLSVLDRCKYVVSFMLELRYTPASGSVSLRTDLVDLTVDDKRLFDRLEIPVETIDSNGFYSTRIFFGLRNGLDLPDVQALTRGQMALVLDSLLVVSGTPVSLGSIDVSDKNLPYLCERILDSKAKCFLSPAALESVSEGER
jgi:hypothetical protein